MNKSLLTLGIILSLGTVGCAGFGVQQSSSLSRQLQKQQGLDGLWSATERANAQGLETPRYADQTLGDLWNEGLGQVPIEESQQRPTGGDLWNPASVTRSWETSRSRSDVPSGGLLFGDSSGKAIRY